jgi:hypothetical protein
VGSLETDGWTLASAEDRHAANPETFLIPSLEARASLRPGDAAKLLFEIETWENGQVVDRGIDRMWVIVKSRAGDRYRGVLDNDPGHAEGLKLREGDEIVFTPEHIVEIGQPSRAYVLEKHGPGFFTD